jgi:predicted ferric reductase
MGLKIGDRIKMNGAFGEFYIKPQTNYLVGVAGGIGITPFRSILYEVACGLFTDTQIHLIYAGKNGFFAFADEIKKFTEHPNINVDFVNTPEEVNASIEHAVKKFGNRANYFISGSPGMIGAIRNTLIGKGVNSITNDPFKGY